MFIQPCKCKARVLCVCKCINCCVRRSMLVSKVTHAVAAGGGALPPSVDKLVFLPSMLPASRTCDNLLHRIRNIFGMPESPLDQPPPAPSVPSVEVGALVRVVRDDGLDSTLLRCRATTSRSKDAYTVPRFAISSSMNLRVLRMDAAAELGFAFVSVPGGQEGFVQCKYLVGFGHAISMPACDSVAVSLMRCVQRVAMRVRAPTAHYIVQWLRQFESPFQELVLGFVDYTSGEAANWDNGRIDVVRAYDRFAAASAPAAAESFLMRHLFPSRALEEPEATARVAAQMLE